MGLLVSGYAQRVPAFMLLLLRRTLKHTATSAGAFEVAAARRKAFRTVGVDRWALEKFTSSRECTRATLQDMQAEISRFYESISGARLLLAGAIPREEAEALASTIRQEL